MGYLCIFFCQCGISSSVETGCLCLWEGCRRKRRKVFQKTRPSSSFLKFYEWMKWNGDEFKNISTLWGAAGIYIIDDSMFFSVNW